jgi:hypothetical protein
MVDPYLDYEKPEQFDIEYEILAWLGGIFRPNAFRCDGPSIDLPP